MVLTTSALPAWARMGEPDPYADHVVGFVSGAGAVPGYNFPARALGAPERFTGEELGFPGAITPFNPAFGSDEIVSIGAGGQLVLEFDEPIVDDPNNPFGLDLIVFGNAGFIDAAFPAGQVRPDGALFGVGVAPVVQVSNDFIDWRTLGPGADALFPTLGFLDLTDAYAPAPGQVLTDFTRPVDPTFDPRGRTFAELIAGYAGSGGGTGFDLAGSGLASARYVRIINVSTSPAAFEIDAISDVSPIPSPSSAILLGVLPLLRGRRRGL
ncbi:MAG: hypothetical protein SFY69_12645 [Planctomycetota bacterium]|nr:hypothetical protein [Planctomycetota bacterium]